jgi:hypothetical protein
MTKTTAIATRSDPLSTSVDPRVRMKEVRANVAVYLKGDTFGLAHLGEMPNNMEDARRVIIAVQDLLETEKRKHGKATNHICELVHLLNESVESQFELLQELDNLGRKIRYLEMQNQINENQQRVLFDASKKASLERDAVLTTMKLMNGQPEPTGYNAARPLPMMAMGLSNKDRS